MSKKRHYRYELRDRRKIVQFGITDDPARREAEHKDDGKRFSSMNIVRGPVTKDSAERWEEQRLATFRKNHGGKNPRYNKTDR